MAIRALVPKAEHKARITRALLKLSSARREKLDAVDFEVYVEGLQQFTAELVERVCEDFALVAPHDYQPRFPPLHELRERALKALELAREQRQLSAASLAVQYPPLSDEKFEDIKRRFREVLAGKVLR